METSVIDYFAIFCSHYIVLFTLFGNACECDCIVLWITDVLGVMTGENTVFLMEFDCVVVLGFCFGHFIFVKSQHLINRLK